MRAPPYTATVRNRLLGASFSASTAICSASSRVGVMTRPIGPFSLCGRQRFMNGRRNAAVLPVPVCAWPITSWPFMAAGMTASWTGVGWT